MEKKGIFDPTVTDEKIVVASFDDNGILQSLENKNNQRVDVPVVDRTTPTGGNEITAIEQILGNVGRFNRTGGGDNAANTASGGVR